MDQAAKPLARVACGYPRYPLQFRIRLQIGLVVPTTFPLQGWFHPGAFPPPTLLGFNRRDMESRRRGRGARDSRASAGRSRRRIPALSHTWSPPICQAITADDEKVKIAAIHPDFVEADASVPDGICGLTPYNCAALIAL